ncbi:unnamed protein product, partial [Rotaria sp. Silwood1]
MEIGHDKYKLAPGLPTLFIHDIQNDDPKSLTEIARLQSVNGGQGLLKCNCKGG